MEVKRDPQKPDDPLEPHPSRRLKRQNTMSKVLEIVSPGGDVQLKQAFYNTAASLFVVLVCGAAVAVYFILQAFVRPLLWAMLIGTLLHPFKNTLTNVIRDWLSELKKARTPIPVGFALMPFQLLNYCSEELTGIVIRNLKLLIALLCSTVILYLAYYYGIVIFIFDGLLLIFGFLYDFLGYFNLSWVYSIVVGYIILVSLTWTEETNRIYKHLSIFIWLLLLVNVSHSFSLFRVPIFLGCLALMVIGFLANVRKAHRSENMAAVWQTFFRDDDISDTGISEVGSDDVGRREMTPSERAIEKQQDDTGASPVKVAQRKITDQCFVALFWTFLATRFWVNPWLLQVLPVIFGYAVIKKIGVQTLIGGYLSRKASNVFSEMKHWWSIRSQAFVPAPIQGAFNLILKGDRKVVRCMLDSLDGIMSLLMMILLFVGAVFFTVFLAVQIHAETSHMVVMTSTLLNDTLHPEISSFLPNDTELLIQNAVESVAGNAYVYGRGFIESKLDELMGNESSVQKTKLQLLVFDVWDQLYNRLVSSNDSKVATVPHHTSISLSGNWSAIWDTVSDGFEVWAIVDVVQNNLEIVRSVLESVWMILKSNINIFSSLLMAIASMLIGGGSAILNFVLSAVIFLTALFYLLASSGDRYKPVEWIINLSPGQAGSKLGQAVDESVGGVFIAALKLSAFYGLYTWTTHTTFGVNLVCIPSALAALFAAVPLLGTYWAALPAVFDLWLIQKQPFLAGLLLLCQLAPASVFDSAVYREIKGGGHPYLTGLSIAGGMYCFGLEGAFIGPIIICCLTICINIYGSVINPQSEPAVDSSQQRREAFKSSRESLQK